MKTKRSLSSLALTLWVLCTCANPVTAQTNDTRPGGTTFLGDTGLWFVPTAEVIGAGRFAASGHVANFNREQGFTAIQSMAGTFAAGLGERVEVFGSFPFLTRIDRDIRPLFRAETSQVGGLINDYPLVDQTFSGNTIGDLVLGLKVNLVSEKQQAPYAAAIRGMVKLPTGDENAGTTSGKVDGEIGIVVSTTAGNVELAGTSAYAIKSDPNNVDLTNGLRWGAGISGPVRGPIRVFGEVLGETLFNDSIALTTPLTGTDGSISALMSPQRSPLDIIVGLQWNGQNGLYIGSGLTWAARHENRSLVGQASPSADQVGFLFRLGYHPGVQVYVPPPPPPPPPAAPPPPPPPPPRPAPPPPPPPPPAPDREYVFEDVHFDFDRYNLRPGATRLLDEVVVALEEDADLRIEIEGHTCNIGTTEYNLALGDRRANSVEEYLTSRGVSGNRLTTVSYGEERPAHDNAREETRRLNRRAALVVRVQ